MKYYKLVFDYENDENYINCVVPHIGEFDEYSTSNGIKLENWDDIAFEYDSEEGSEVSDYVANVFRWLMVSDAFYKSIVNEVTKENVQFLPVKIIDKIGFQQDITCQVVNILDIVDNALDLDNLKYEIFELDDENIISVERYALKKDVILGHDLFRLKGDTIPIFCFREN